MRIGLCSPTTGMIAKRETLIQPTGQAELSYSPLAY